MSNRALQRKHGVGYRTVTAALNSAWPAPRKAPPKRGSRLGPYQATIDGWLRDDLDAPRKQRHTAKRIFDRLLDEHHAIEVSYWIVREYVAIRRREIRIEAGREPPNTFIPQEHLPGREAEVDFGEVWVVLGGVRTKCYMFVLWLSHSGKAIHRVYPTQAQEAFLQGHIEAFDAIGGIPTKHIKYDNLTSAVTAVIHGPGRARNENDRWVLFRSHYGFDAFYCQSGIEGAHEKGGVEGAVGWFRRNHLVPMPEVDSLDQLNEQIKAWEAADEDRRISGRLNTIGHDFTAEQPLLRPLPMEVFEPGLVLNPRVDRSSMISVRMVKYSVPAHLIGRRVRVSLRATEVVVFEGRTVVAMHPRVVARGTSRVVLDHYLEVLRFKPGALPGSTALAQARAAGVFTSAHEAFWAASRKVNGDADGTRELVDVLLLHRSLTAEQVTAGIAAALTVGAVSADVVAVEARRHTPDTTTATGGASSDRHHVARGDTREQRVVSLTQRRLTDPAAVIAGLPPDTRPIPSVVAYDELLPRRRTTTPPTPDVKASTS